MIARRRRAAAERSRRRRGRWASRDRVVFAGFRRDLDRLLPAFSVFCLSSHLEGLGTSLLDAMAFGLPDRGDRRGRDPRGGGGRRDRAAWCRPRDPAALAEALADVLCDDGAAGRLGRRGRDAAISSASPPTRMVDETLARAPGGRVKVRAILNPRAGVSRDEARRAAERGRPALERLRPSPSPTGPATPRSSRGRPRRRARTLVLSVGGDGTANEVARGLIGSAAALGIVPVGSGNGLARALRIPLRPGPRPRRPRDRGAGAAWTWGSLNGQPFLNVAGIGFDAVVGRAFHDSGRRGGRRGLLGYVRLSLREMIRYRAPRLVIEAGGERLEVRPFVLTIANGPQYGSGRRDQPRRAARRRPARARGPRRRAAPRASSPPRRGSSSAASTGSPATGGSGSRAPP